jgi:hypothetical protein
LRLLLKRYIICLLWLILMRHVICTRFRDRFRSVVRRQLRGWYLRGWRLGTRTESVTAYRAIVVIPNGIFGVHRLQLQENSKTYKDTPASVAVPQEHTAVDKVLTAKFDIHGRTGCIDQSSTKIHESVHHLRISNICPAL